MQYEIISISSSVEEANALKLAPPVKTDMDFMLFRTTILLMVPDDVVLSHYDWAKASAVSKDKMIICLYVDAFFHSLVSFCRLKKGQCLVAPNVSKLLEDPRRYWLPQLNLDSRSGSQWAFSFVFLTSYGWLVQKSIMQDSISSRRDPCRDEGRMVKLFTGSKVQRIGKRELFSFADASGRYQPFHWASHWGSKIGYAWGSI